MCIRDRLNHPCYFISYIRSYNFSRKPIVILRGKLAPQNHYRFSAEVVRPYVRDEITWVIEHHGIFQMIYYAHHYGWDKNARDKFKDNIYFQTCADFCERWDQKSFDPEYENKDLDFFKPLIKEAFSRPPYKDEYIKKNEVLGLPKV